MDYIGVTRYLLYVTMNATTTDDVTVFISSEVEQAD